MSTRRPPIRGINPALAKARLAARQKRTTVTGAAIAAGLMAFEADPSLIAATRNPMAAAAAGDRGQLVVPQEMAAAILARAEALAQRVGLPSGEVLARAYVYGVDALVTDAGTKGKVN